MAMRGMRTTIINIIGKLELLPFPPVVVTNSVSETVVEPDSNLALRFLFSVSSFPISLFKVVISLDNCVISPSF